MKIRDPYPGRGDFLPTEGRWVEQSAYWQKRLKEGDIEIIKDAK
jgi:hypothetical protein